MTSWRNTCVRRCIACECLTKPACEPLSAPQSKKKCFSRPKKKLFPGGQVSHSHRPISMSCRGAKRDSNSRSIAQTLSQLHVRTVCRTTLPCIIIAVRRTRCLPTSPCLCENRCHYNKTLHRWYVGCTWRCRINHSVNRTRNRDCKSVQYLFAPSASGCNNAFLFVLCGTVPINVPTRYYQ